MVMFTVSTLLSGLLSMLSGLFGLLSMPSGLLCVEESESENVPFLALHL